MRLSFLAGLALTAALLSACQSLDGSDTTALSVATAAEEPLVLTDEPGRLGREQFARANYALASRYFQRAVELTPNDGDSWVGLAASYDQLGRFDLADRAYVKATQLKGQTVQILNNRGYSYLLRGDGGRARAMFARAQALNPANQTVANNIEILHSAPQ